MATSKMKHKRIPAAEFVEMQNQLHQLTATGLDVKSARDRIAQQHGADPASFDKRMKRYAQDSLRATSTSNNAASPNATSISAQQELCLLYLIDVTSAIHEPMKKSDFIAFVRQTLIPEQRREHWRGGQWCLHFLNRNNNRIRLSDIKTITPARVSVDHLQNLPHWLIAWYHQMQSHGIDQECQLLNLDEFQLKETEVAKKSKCVVSRSHKSPHIVSKRNAGAGTLIALVGMDGQMHWAGVVLKADGKKKKKKDDPFQTGYLEVDSLLDVPYATRHSKTVDSVIVTEGANSTSLTFMELIKLAVAKLRAENPGLRYWLLMDGLASHLKKDVIWFLIQNDIWPMIGLPNTTQVLQPLDQSFFGHLRRQINSNINEHGETAPASVVQRNALAKVLKGADFSRLIKNSWRQAGYGSYDAPFRFIDPKRIESILRGEIGVSTQPQLPDVLQDMLNSHKQFLLAKRSRTDRSRTLAVRLNHAYSGQRLIREFRKKEQEEEVKQAKKRRKTKQTPVASKNDQWPEESYFCQLCGADFRNATNEEWLTCDKCHVYSICPCQDAAEPLIQEHENQCTIKK